MINYLEKNLKSTIEAINKLIENNSQFIDTKTIRRINNIKSSERSKTHFIWHSLEIFHSQGYLERNGQSKPRRYKIISKAKIDFNIVKTTMNKEKI